LVDGFADDAGLSEYWGGYAYCEAEEAWSRAVSGDLCVNTALELSEPGDIPDSGDEALARGLRDSVDSGALWADRSESQQYPFICEVP
jgi:hypothetical protein